MIVSGQFALIGVQDATVFEFCYKATSNSGRPATPTSADTDGSLPSGWLREPPDVSAVNAYVWESQRSKTEGLSWGKWSTPVLKNRWANDGASVITANTYKRQYTYSQWQVYGETGHVDNWTNISNASQFGKGDTMIIPGVCTDRDNIGVSLYAEVVSVSGTTVVASTTNIIFGGGKGARMRIRDWAVGLVCLQGKEGEDFYDIVVYQTKLYLCTKSHTASNANNPVASVSGNLGYWEIAQDWVFVATRLLLAEKIKADQIDADGLVAKDVNVTGTITANDGLFMGKLNIGDGKNIIEKDGSGKLAAGNISWDKLGNVSFFESVKFFGFVNYGAIQFSTKVNSDGSRLYYTTSSTAKRNKFMIYPNSDNDAVALPRGKEWDGVLLYIYNCSTSYRLKIFMGGSETIPAKSVGVFWGYSFNTDVTLWAKIAISGIASILGVDESSIE